MITTSFVDLFNAFTTHPAVTSAKNVFQIQGTENNDRELLSPAQLRRIVNRERARTDRSGREFAFILFSFSNDDGNQDAVKHLSEILTRRLRFTDDKGLTRNGRVGVVAPETNASQANVLARDVCATYQLKRSLLDYEVYVYPSNKSVDNDDHGDTKPAERHESTRLPIGRDSALSAAPLETILIRRMPVWKRGFDIIGATVGLMLSAPIIGIAAALIKLNSSGPVFFTQTRAGLGGEPFTMFKLRTMCVDAEARKQELREQSEQDGPAFKMKNDPRVTLIGRVLRKTSIDELPQLWNVLRGEMSLVGPRPLPVDEAAACRPWQRQRLDVTPGLTCIWQIEGRSTVSFDEWIRMDVRYIRQRSFWQDMLLVLKTIPAVFTRKGAV